MKVLCLVAIIIVVVTEATPTKEKGVLQVIGKELAKETDLKSEVQILGNSMDIEFLYQTDNKWNNINNIQNTLKGYYPVDIYHSQDDLNPNSLMPMRNESMRCKNSVSKLPNPIKDLICLIFDVDGMKRTMVELGIDLLKMPLEELSKEQIMKGYQILTELETALSRVTVDQIEINDASNRFYMIIPHHFDMQKPAQLNNINIIKSKTDMLENLLGIEFAYSIIYNSSRNSDRDVIDNYYKKLKNQINVLDNSSIDYSVISKYITNGHDTRYFNITLRNIFQLARQGEEKRYKPFKQMPNRQLLWHGSGVSNFARILSEGLRIALAGNGIYGKGIYFADLFDLSAAYSWNGRNSTALLLLSEVALGNMYELPYSKPIIKLPKGKQSVKGVGRLQPDPNFVFTLSNGVKVPYGPLVPSNFEYGLYNNMYIIFDEAQIKQQYLVEVYIH